jgi:uncharacterized protein with HXXEE motif
VSAPRAPGRAGAWVWLFPATMLLHVVEEGWTAETFPAWITRVAGVDLGRGEFLVLNAVALAVILLGAWLARTQPWALAALGTATGTNVLLHLGGTILTGTWSPGLATAALLWGPLATVALIHVARHGRRRDLALGLIVGFLAHGAVSLSLVLA